MRPAQRVAPPFSIAQNSVGRTQLPTLTRGVLIPPRPKSDGLLRPRGQLSPEKLARRRTKQTVGVSPLCARPPYPLLQARHGARQPVKRAAQRVPARHRAKRRPVHKPPHALPAKLARISPPPPPQRQERRLPNPRVRRALPPPRPARKPRPPPHRHAVAAPHRRARTITHQNAIPSRPPLLPL